MKKVLIFAVIGMFSSFSFAEHHMKMMGEMPTMTKEQREMMAKNHDMMAQCLRSEKTMKECHESMKDSCEKNMGADMCPMHGMGMMGMGKKHKMMKMAKDKGEKTTDTEKTEMPEKK